ncbi:MAG: response regulator, partial [bacterium]
MAKLMVIDDDESVRDILKRMLEAVGHRVTCIEDGLYAEKAIRKDRPDLIISDVLMPGLDGHALVYHLKYNTDLHHIPVMLLTSLGDEKAYLGREVDADCFMAKPIDEEKLLQKVEQLLNLDRIRIKKNAELLHNRAATRKVSAIIVMCVSMAIVVASVIFYLTVKLSQVASMGSKTIVDDMRSISFLADKVI